MERPHGEDGYRNGQLLITADGTARTNVAASANGGTASASSTNTGGSGYPASAVNNGDRKGLNANSGGIWVSASGSFPQWAEVDFNGSKTIDEVDVFTLQDAVTSPAEPTPTMTFRLYGLQGYDVQYWERQLRGRGDGQSVSGSQRISTALRIVSSKL